MNIKIIEIDARTVRISLPDGDPNTMVSHLNEALERQIKIGKSLIIFDMVNVEFPNGSFIAMLISITSIARSKGVDLQIVNMGDTARSHFGMFTPLAFLSIGEDVMTTRVINSEDAADFIEGKLSRIELEAVVDELGSATDFVVARAEKAGFEKIELSKFKIAVYEACMNIIEHGYGFDPDHFMVIELFWGRGRFEVTLKDKGKSFDFYNRVDYNVDEAFNEKRDGGFGLFIIQRSVDEIHYKSDLKSGNSLTLVKYIVDK